MITVEAHKKYVARMLNNPRARPVFEEYYNVLGYYPPYFEGTSFTDINEETLAEIKRMTEVGRKALGK